MPRAPSDLDLRRTDAGAPRKRTRKDRKKPDPPANLKAGESDALAFVQSLPLNPGLITERRGEQWQVQAPHNDGELWRLQLAQAFGTRSDALLRSFVDQLAKLCPQDWDADRQAWKADETEWNALLALVADHKPENSAQAALAAQMAATHLMTMRLSSQALNRGHVVIEKDAALASKLARTFATQCETMLLLKGKSRTARQSIHVTKETHQHVHYHDERGEGENGNQSHGRNAAAVDDTGEVVRGEESGRKALPRPSREGERTVPLSRGTGGSAKG